MSAGTPAPVEGRAAEPGVPVPENRAHILARLEAERRQAIGCFEDDRAAELGRQIEDLSRPVQGNPRTETTSRARSTAARRSK